MKKLLFVMPLLVVFSLATMPVVSADDAVELAIQAALGTDPANVSTVAGIARTTLDELRGVEGQIADPNGGRTIGDMVRQAFNLTSDIRNIDLVDPGTGFGGRTVGWMTRQTITELRDLQADVDSLQQDVANLQASVDEVIELLKTPQGRRSGWNQ